MNQINYQELKTAYSKNPLNIEDSSPTLSWNVETGQRGWMQGAYQILVADDKALLDKDQGNLWDSGMVESSNMRILYQGTPFSSDTQYYWKVRVMQKGQKIPAPYSEVQTFRTSLLKKEDWHGKWIGVGEEKVNPLFRTTVPLNKKVVSARAYICGLGHFELILNGQKASDYVLEPGWTDYRKTCFYVCYDVTDLLRTGRNTVGISLGNGMYNAMGGEGRYIYYPRKFGDMQAILQLNLTFEDGTTGEIITDENWTTAASPRTFSCLYGGEDYDARLEIDHWDNLPEGAADTWKKASVVAPPQGELHAQKNMPLKVMETFQAQKIIPTGKDTYIYDLGQNFSGLATLRVSGPAGASVKLTPCEVLSEDNKPNQRTSGSPYFWTYTLKGDGVEEWMPKFTIYGFRYVQVEGGVPRSLANEQETLPVVESICGNFIYPEMDLIGDFSCSNELFNRIHILIRYSMASNTKSVFTDCPHREKFGWLEETHLIGPALMYNYDLHNLFHKVSGDIRDSQRDNGLVADIAPEYVRFGYHRGFIDSPEWGSASIITPWYAYKKYGDISFLRNNYDVMQRYLNYLTSQSHHCLLHHGLGDWLDVGPKHPRSQNTSVSLVASSIYFYDLAIMEKIANLLDKKEDAARYAAQKADVKTEFNIQFYDDQTGMYETGSQAAQAMPLIVGLVPEEEIDKVVANLVKDVEVRDYATTAGDVGHPFVMAALTMFGRSDIIDKMMRVEDAPSYGYQLKYGATALTERWDGPHGMTSEDHGPVSSQNHFMLGSGDEWFFAGLAGIKTIRTEYPDNIVEISPYIPEDMEWVRVWHQIPNGKVDLEWKQDSDKTLSLTLRIPANTTAIIKLPGNLSNLTESGKPAGQAEGVLSVEQQGEAAVAIVSSGAYSFQLKR